MARYRFVEKSPAGATVLQYPKTGEPIAQEFAPEIGGLAYAIEYAKGHGKRQDLADHYIKTEVVYFGVVVYTITPEKVS